jgi:hypothetical protein
MIHRLEIYLDQVMAYGGLPPAEATTARNELKDHLLARIDDLEAQGATRDDAAFRAIHEHGRPWVVGYGLRPRFPWIDVRVHGTARGVFAVGPKAVGIVACGIVSTGVISCGVLSFGVLSLGVIACAMFSSFGIISAGSISLGINAMGLIAAGINSAGIVAGGLNSAGLWVFNGKNVLSYYDEQSVPRWLQELGFSVSWNTLETTLAFAPILCVWMLLIASALCFARGERRRLRDSGPWIVQ